METLSTLIFEAMEKNTADSSCIWTSENHIRSCLSQQGFSNSTLLTSFLDRLEQNNHIERETCPETKIRYYSFAKSIDQPEIKIELRRSKRKILKLVRCTRSGKVYFKK